MISIIVPFYNEKDSLPTLIKHLIEVGNKLKSEYEVILVDDGSNDNFQFSLSRRQTGILNFQKNIKLIKHRKKLGKGEALKTGIKNSSGDIIVFIDADLQDDPEDLRLFLQKIEDGYDFVNGIRTKREDNFLVKTYSLIAKKFLRMFLNSPFTDINCGFKVFRKEVLSGFSFYGNNFRFFPLFVFYNGYKVTEITVINHQRKFGKSKFGKSKLMNGVFDTLTAYFLYKFSENPLHFFGTWGLISFLAGGVILMYLGIERIFYHILLYRRPILFLGMLLVIVGIQIVMTGIISELIVFLHNKDNNK